MIAQIKAVDEKLLTWETETPCGGCRSKVCGNGPGTHNNSWSWGEGQFSYMRSFLESGASVYSQWNMVFKKTAVPAYFLDKNDRFTKTGGTNIGKPEKSTLFIYRCLTRLASPGGSGASAPQSLSSPTRSKSVTRAPSLRQSTTAILSSRARWCWRPAVTTDAARKSTGPAGARKAA